MRDPAVAASRYVDANGVKHIDLSLLNKKPKKQNQILSDADQEAQERDLFNFIFKYENFVKESAMIQRIVQNTNSQDIIFSQDTSKPKTDEEKELEMIRESLQSQNLCKQFQDQLMQIETGEMQIKLNESAQIERSIHQFNLLQKFKPLNYEGTLQDVIKEINNKFDSGWEIDYDLIKKNLALSYKSLIESKNRKNQASAYKRKDVIPIIIQPDKAKEAQEDKVLKMLGTSNLANMDKEQLQLYGVNNMMSLIELQSLQDKVNDKMRQVEIKHKLNMLESEQDLGKLSKKELFQRKMAEQKARQKKGLTFKQIFEQEKIAEYNRRQKMFNQMRVVNRAAVGSTTSLRSRPKEKFSSVNLQSIISRISQQHEEFKLTNEKIETVKKEQKDLSEAQILQQRQEILAQKTKILERQSTRQLNSVLEKVPGLESNLQKYVSVKNVTEYMSPVSQLTPASPTRNPAEMSSEKYQIPQNIILEDDEMVMNEDTELHSPQQKQQTTEPSVESNQDLVNLILDKDMNNLLGVNQSSHRVLTHNNSSDLKSKNEDIQNKGEIIITDTKANRLRNDAIFMRELQLQDILYFLRLGISKKKNKEKQNHMIEQNDLNKHKYKIQSREKLLQNSFSFDFNKFVNFKSPQGPFPQLSHQKKAETIQYLQDFQTELDSSVNKNQKPQDQFQKMKRGFQNSSIQKQNHSTSTVKLSDYLSPKLKMMQDQKKEEQLKFQNNSRIHKNEVNQKNQVFEKVTSKTKDEIVGLEEMSEVDQEDSMFSESQKDDTQNQKDIQKAKNLKKKEIKVDGFKRQKRSDQKAQNKLQIEIPQLSVIFKNKEGDSSIETMDMKPIQKLKPLKAKPQKIEPPEQKSIRSLLKDSQVALHPEPIKSLKQKMSKVESKLNLGFVQRSQEMTEQQMIEKQEQFERSQRTRLMAQDVINEVQDQFEKSLVKNIKREKNFIKKRAMCKKKEQEILSGIDSFQFQNQKLQEVSDLLTLDEIKESLPQIKDIIKQNQEREQFDHTNFLSANVAQKFKQDNYNNTEKLNKIGRGIKIWQPNKLRLNCKIFGNQIERADEYKL